MSHIKHFLHPLRTRVCSRDTKCFLNTISTSTNIRLNGRNISKVYYSVDNSSKTAFYSPSKLFCTSAILDGIAARCEVISKLNKDQAMELALRLTQEERDILLTSLQEFKSKSIKDEYEGQLAAFRWRSKFGRPSKLPSLGDVDPTGTYCAVPEDWLQKKYAETVPPPTVKNLIEIGVANSIPFIGFGFLDNFIMIVAGDYIDATLGSYMCISTMAAAALGNTFSDVLGIGSAYYVERVANQFGFKPPKLSPIQMDMVSSRWAANIGRAVGVTIGCLIGMLPLLFLNASDDEKEKKSHGKGKISEDKTPDLAVAVVEAAASADPPRDL